MTRRVKDLQASQLSELRDDWVAGLLPQTVIAAKHNVDVEDLKAHANAAGWNPRDLGKAVRAATTRALVERTVSDADREAGRLEPVTQDSAVTIHKYGQIAAGVVESHRKILARALGYVDRILLEIETLEPSDLDHEAIRGLAKAIAEQNPELAKALTETKGPISFKERVQLTAVKVRLIHGLSVPLERYVKLQREAYGLDKAEGETAGYDEFLDELHGEDPPEKQRTLKVVK